VRSARSARLRGAAPFTDSVYRGTMQSTCHLATASSFFITSLVAVASHQQASRNFLGHVQQTPASELGVSKRLKTLPGARTEFKTGGDGYLDQTIWKGDSMAYDFGRLDDLEPVAPFDKIGSSTEVDSRTGHDKSEREEVAGSLQALHVPPYLYPDAFPSGSGASGDHKCLCSLPEDASKNAVCECANSAGTVNGEEAPHQIHWMNVDPVHNTNSYTLTAADTTYSSGDYWHPKLKGGLVAPADRLPKNRYPNQAPMDEIHPLPATARKDQLAVRFGKYIDQVEARSRECDKVSKKCTVPCGLNDEVLAHIGNSVAKATIVKAHAGQALTIRFIPQAARGQPGPSCVAQDGCTVFRPCLQPMSTCVQLKDKAFNDWSGVLRRKVECPGGTTACGSIEQMVSSTFLTKEGENCRASFT